MDSEHQDTHEEHEDAPPPSDKKPGVVRVTARKRQPSASTASAVSFDPPTPLLPGQPVAPSVVVQQREANKEYLEQKQELSQLLGTFDFEGGTYQVAVSRKEPRYHHGKLVAGHIGTFKRKVDLDELRDRFGGGTFRFVVQRQNGQFVTSKEVDIFGDPIVQDDPRKAGDMPQGVQLLVQQSLADANKRADDVKEELREMRRMAMEQQKQAEMTMAQVLAAALNGNGGKSKEEIDLLREQMRHERQERIAAEERAEQRRREERAEERRMREAERAEAERRHEQALKMMEMREERLRDEARLRIEADRKIAEIQAQAQQRQAEMQAKMQREIEQERAQQAEKNMQLMIRSMESTTATQMQAMQRVDEMKDRFLEKALSKKEDGLAGFESLLKAKHVIDALSGNGDDDKPQWETVIDKVGEIGPSLLAAAGFGGAAIASARSNSGGGGGGGGSGGGVRRRRRMRPNTTIVAEVEETPTPAQGTSAIVKKEQPQEQPAEEESVEEGPKNDYDKLRFPDESEQGNIAKVFEMIVKDIDFAMEHDFTAAGIVEQVVLKFPPHVVEYIKSQPADALLGLVQQKAPRHWRINTPGGRRTLREVHQILVKKE